jgi:hypothetical protein
MLEPHLGDEMQMDELEATLVELRTYLEPLWKSWKDENKPWWVEDEILSTGMCRFTAAFLHPLLEDITGRSWEIKGGMTAFHVADSGWTGKGKPNSSWSARDGMGGMKTVAGTWEDHYWLTDGTVNVDLTADQFGWEPILVTDVGDDRYLANWKKKSVIGHMDGVRFRAGEWRSDWLALASPPPGAGPGP